MKKFFLSILVFLWCLLPFLGYGVTTVKTNQTEETLSFLKEIAHAEVDQYRNSCESYFNGNQYEKAEMTGRYTMYIISAVIPVSKVNLFTKIKNFTGIIKSLPKKFQSIIKKLKNNQLPNWKIKDGATSGDLKKLVYGENEVPIFKISQDNTPVLLIEQNKFIDDFTPTEIVDELGEVAYKKWGANTSEVGELVLIEKSDGTVGVGRLANGVDNLVSSIKARLTTLKNPARPILEGEGIPLVNGKFSKELGTNKFDNIITGNYGEASKKYIWTIDDNGINIGLEQTSIGSNSVIKHTNLSTKAYSGGEVWFTDIETVHVNAWSGRFGAGANMTKIEWEASIDAWKSLGYKVVIEPYTP